MSLPEWDYEGFSERLRAWAGTQADIRAILVVGSRARTERPADRWADLDLLLVTTNPARYLAGTGWLAGLGDPWLTFLEKTATGTRVERRVLFAGGLDVDFTPVACSEIERIVAQGWPPEAATVVARGLRVLLDKDGLTRRLPPLPAAPPAAPLPSREEFLNLAQDYLYHVIWTAKKLRRGETWTAKLCCDGYMKRRLLELLEWHARAAAGGGCDTWHNGRFLEQWADPLVLAELPGAFAPYDPAGIWQALRRSLALFRRLATETGARLGYAYPVAGHEQVGRLLDLLAPEP